MSAKPHQYALPSQSHGAWLSIIIPVLNEATLLREALLRLQEVRKHGAQIIVVDGTSHDGSAQVAAGFADVVLTCEPQRARQMNLGAAHAQGAAFLFLHADTTLPDDAIARIRAVLRRCAWGRFDVCIDGRSVLLPVVSRMMNWRSRLTGVATGDQAIFCTRELFVRAGGFAQQPLMEDIAFSKAARAIAPPACLRHKVRTSGRRWDQRGALKTIMLMWWLRFAYWVGVSPQRLAQQYYGAPRQERSV